ncbi:MAG: DNA alkylation response protein, partial [Oricola sp.]|nr:DNA alkylation response protein [Oricola sp.]
MTHFRPRSDLDTHDVTNQPPPFENVNLFDTDRALKETAEQRGGAPHLERLSAYGTSLGSAEMIENARLAHQNPPKLISFDRYGHRLDEVEFHPAYHALMGLGLSSGYASIAWTAKEGGHVAHAAMVYMQAGGEPGVGCPMTMTYAAVPALRHEPDVAREWVPRIIAGAYDKRFIPA